MKTTQNEFMVERPTPIESFERATVYHESSNGKETESTGKATLFQNWVVVWGEHWIPADRVLGVYDENAEN